MTARAIPATAALAAYVGAIVAANWLTSRYGLIWVAPGLATTAGTYAAGAALLARDALQDATGRYAVLAAILAGAGLSVWLSTPQLAAASGAAFLLAETCDMAVYTPLRRRGWARAVLASNAVGGLLDTVVFLWLARFPLTAATVGGQLVGKLAWATAVPVAAVVLIRKVGRLALPRHPIES